jgi:hypothetical protein
MSGGPVFRRFLITTIAVTFAFAEPTASGNRLSMLSSDSFSRARTFINDTGRPLDRALFAFHFSHGSPDAVIAELVKFQNRDGGFASKLDADTRWDGSSPMGTMIALRIMNEVGTTADEMPVKAAVRYLLGSFDQKKGYWHAVPKEANSAPHAPWWDVHVDSGKCDVESPVFPTAALAGYLRAYSTLLPPGFLDRITKSSLEYLSRADSHMPMSDIEALTNLVRFLPPADGPHAIAKIGRILSVVVVRNPQQWSTYAVQPITFVRTPVSPFYALLKEAIPANLDYIISTQQADGGWKLTWSWKKIDPSAWRIAEREWRAAVTLENLQTLEAFHRINY